MKKQYRCKTCDKVYDWPHLVRHQCIPKEEITLVVDDGQPDEQKEWQDLEGEDLPAE